MYILYVDDAGSAKNSEEKHFVLGGVALFEAHGYFLQTELEKVVTDTGLANPSELELQGNEILSGRNKWRAMRDRDQRRSVISSALSIQHKFDSEGGVVHGLLHEPYANSSCRCAYCASRRA